MTPRRRARPQAAAASVPASGGSAFICRGRYFVYNEAPGSPSSGIVPGTRFADLPPGWQCPDGGTDKTTFRLYTATV